VIFRAVGVSFDSVAGRAMIFLGGMIFSSKEELGRKMAG